MHKPAHIRGQNMLVIKTKQIFQQYFSNSIVVCLIGGGSQSTRIKQPICRKSFTNFITYYSIDYILLERDSNAQR